MFIKWTKSCVAFIQVALEYETKSPLNRLKRFQFESEYIQCNGWLAQKSLIDFKVFWSAIKQF